MVGRISIEQFRALYNGEDEFAVIDPREELFFARGHLLGATNMPLSRQELLIKAGIPNRETPVVICDDGDGLSEQTSKKMLKLGYENSFILDGGLPVWALTGGAVFSGVNVRSKAFGEFVEKNLETPTISAKDLHSTLIRGEDVLLLDARPADEHEQYCIPGSISCPSAELILRCAELASDQNQKVVVHCAGRTRSIVGAQTLIDSGLFASVQSLCNGTPGWEFEGWTIEKGNKQVLGKPDYAGLSSAKAAAENLRNKFAVPALDHVAFAKWCQAGGTRYLFDVRTSEEFATGHLKGSRHIPGGQLLQTTDQHIVVENAHIALIDDDNVRAVTTAMWLKRMGWRNVVTYEISPSDPDLKSGQDGCETLAQNEFLTLHEALQAYREETAVFLDIRRSFDFRRGHVTGSSYLNRSNLSNDLINIPKHKLHILFSNDPDFASLLRDDLIAMGRKTCVLESGIDGWVAAGGSINTGIGEMLSRPIDTYFESDHYDDFKVHIREHHAYLNWEIALIDHIVGDPAARFAIGST